MNERKMNEAKEKTEKCYSSAKRRTTEATRVLRGAGGGDNDEVEIVSLENMQNVPVVVAIPPLIVENVFLSDNTPKDLVLAGGAHEPNASRRGKLNSFLHRMYVSFNTSGFQCACALHAP